MKELASATQKGKTKIPELLSIDTKIGLSHMADNETLYLKILNNFYSDYYNLDLESLESVDEDEYTIVIHTLKGLSANIGALELNKIVTKLEEADGKRELKSLKIELEKVLQELKKIERLQKETANVAITTAQRDELFERLKEAVKIKRIQKCRPIIEEMQQYALNEKDMQLFTEVKKFIEKFDFKKAMETLS